MKAVHSVDPDVALAEFTTLAARKDNLFTDDRFSMLLYGGFALVALLLATGGICGVISFAVSQRVHEIGLRMGLGIEVIGAQFFGRLMQSTLYGIAPAFRLVAPLRLIRCERLKPSERRAGHYMSSFSPRRTSSSSSSSGSVRMVPSMSSVGFFSLP